MFMIKDCGEGDGSRYIPIASSNEGDWKELHEQAASDIVVAHSWFRSLSGLDYASGFNAERILHEYEVALNTVILSAQEELLDPLKAIMEEVLREECDSLAVVNRPPTRSKPLYMKVWEARKADGSTTTRRMNWNSSSWPDNQICDEEHRLMRGVRDNFSSSLRM